MGPKIGQFEPAIREVVIKGKRAGDVALLYDLEAEAIGKAYASAVFYQQPSDRQVVPFLIHPDHIDLLR